VDVTDEHERKLDAPDGFELPDLGGSPLEPRVFTSVYYDVPERSLSYAGITLRRRTEHGLSAWQLKLPQAGSRLELSQLGGPAGPPEELRRLLAAHVRDRSLLPIAELRTRRRGALVTRDGSTAEVTVDNVSVMDALRVTQEFVEVEIELRSGDPAQLDRIAKEVARAGARPANGTPKVFRALGLQPEPKETPVDPFEMLRSLLRVQHREILRYDPGTRLGTDPESLHDMRVAVRRSRALLRVGRKLVASDTEVLMAELKWLGGALGAVRDLDVLLARLGEETTGLGADEKAAGRLLRMLSRDRTRARAGLLRALNTDRYLGLLDRYDSELSALEPTGADVSLASLAQKEVRKLRRAVRALPIDPADDELHALRKLGKRARYASELAGHAAVVKRAKSFQDVLGEHQDAVVAQGRVRELAADAARAEAIAAGRLIEREELRRRTARAAWPDAWRRLERAAK
jgi:CHAD domain-containing protein